MRPKQQQRSGTDDLFRLKLENIIDMKHPLVRLTARMDWGYLDDSFAPHSARAGPGGHTNATRPPITRQPKGDSSRTTRQRELTNYAASPPIDSDPARDCISFSCRRKTRASAFGREVLAAVGP